MKSLDQQAIDNVGIPALCLMENAGRAVADEAARMFRARRSSGRCVCVVCGSGNNGGDGLVAARHLLNKGFKVYIFLAENVARLSAESRINYRVVKKLKIPCLKWDSRGRQMLCRSDLIIDAIFGIGLSRPVEGFYRQVIEAVNGFGRPVLSVDVPSGLDATSGNVMGACVKATVTATLAYPKQGLFIGDGPHYAGRVIVVDIGIPYSIKP